MLLDMGVEPQQVRSLAPSELVLGLDLGLVAGVVGQVLQVVGELLLAGVGSLPGPCARQDDVVPSVGHLQMIQSILENETQRRIVLETNPT